MTALGFLALVLALTAASQMWLSRRAPRGDQGQALLVPATGPLHMSGAPPPRSGAFPLLLHVPPGTTHFVVRMEPWAGGAPVQTVFIRAGERAQVGVPAGVYRLRMASGSSWYGVERLFGLWTRVSRATAPLEFKQEGGQMRGHQVWLGKRVGGNLPTVQESTTTF